MYEFSYQSVEINPIFIVIWLAIVVLMIASLWKVFTKAGKPGWAAIVPIYNIIVLIEIAQKPMWWLAIILLGPIIPIAGGIAALVFMILLCIAIAEKFGQSQGFGVGLALLGFIFYPILAFGDAVYEGETIAGDDEILDSI